MRALRATGLQDVPEAHYCKGSYFSLQPAKGSRRPFRGLVCPLGICKRTVTGTRFLNPTQQGWVSFDSCLMVQTLGVHATVDLAGDVRFGPDTEWLRSRLPSGRETDIVAFAKYTVAWQLHPGTPQTPENSTQWILVSMAAHAVHQRQEEPWDFMRKCASTGQTFQMTRLWQTTVECDRNSLPPVRRRKILEYRTHGGG